MVWLLLSLWWWWLPLPRVVSRRNQVPYSEADRIGKLAELNTLEIAPFRSAVEAKGGACACGFITIGLIIVLRHCACLMFLSE